MLGGSSGMRRTRHLLLFLDCVVDCKTAHDSVVLRRHCCHLANHGVYLLVLFIFGKRKRKIRHQSRAKKGDTSLFLDVSTKQTYEDWSTLIVFVAVPTVVVGVAVVVVAVDIVVVVKRGSHRFATDPEDLVAR
ncbi:hypothetical protein BDB00DRAFT_343467 [Zychaea mexicana]|uniref:uncharacterized protein n=1 Tax=Zychaea mexicana TaxID=64656 RepID=UPI0022FF39C6|nr:uncharacterized protein BDB00DRAFT_343467 [Zychaea mexicana]KAI9494035.1 hypothetical protein BDB00DRAFT_343467 [Zychaea mexicana]